METRRLSGPCVELDKAGEDNNGGGMGRVGQGRAAMTTQKMGGGSSGSTQRSGARVSQDGARPTPASKQYLLYIKRRLIHIYYTKLIK